MPGIRVLIAEDEPDVREALVDLVSSDPEMEVVGEASNAAEAAEVAIRLRPDVALLDVKMPEGGGSQAARAIRQGSPQTLIVGLSAYQDRRTVLDMIRAGVVGYVVKGAAADEILRTIRRAMRGQGTLSTEITGDVIRELASSLDRTEELAGELEELNRTKSDLIQILAHELFTPITSIQGFALTVAEHGEGIDPDDLRALGEGVGHASARLRRLVGNLRAAAALDREAVVIAARPIAVGDVVGRASSEFADAVERLETPTDPDRLLHRVWADPDLAPRALAIVIENALDIAPPDTTVDIGIDVGGEQVAIAVSDRGPGVSDDARERIFGAFTQADHSATRSHEGLGIGLYLARRILWAHDGDITYEPRDGGGSTFRLTFPWFEGADGAPPDGAANAE